MVFVLQQFQFHAGRNFLAANLGQFDEARGIDECLQDKKDQQGDKDGWIHNSLGDTGDSCGDAAARQGRQQSKGEMFSLLARLGEKRLAQEQHSQQKTHRK